VELVEQVAVELKQPAARRHFFSRRVVIQHLPARAAAAVARRAREAPDLAVDMQLIELCSIGRYLDPTRVVIQHPPARTAIAAARRACEAPDRAVDMQLVEISSIGDDVVGARIGVEHDQAGTAVAVACCPVKRQIRPSGCSW
jgi:hypothetical protein